MKYMVLIADTEEGWSSFSDEEQAGLYGRISAWWDEQGRAGKVLEGHKLEGPETATTVRRDLAGNVTVTDGPFLEAKEVIGGYAVIDVADLDEAIALVSQWPAPDILEIRPLSDQM
jgi:hypothetical protein